MNEINELFFNTPNLAYRFLLALIIAIEIRLVGYDWQKPQRWFGFNVGKRWSTLAKRKGKK